MAGRRVVADVPGAIRHPFFGTLQNASETRYAVQVGDLQWVRIPSGQSVARPEATRAAQDRAACVKQVIDA